jgi:lipoprotein-releasing system ATP-binding protein
VAIARAIGRQTKLLSANEPTGNLDSGNTNLVFDIFKDLAHNKGITILTVTHDLDFAKNADRIIEMVDGKIVSQ